MNAKEDFFSLEEKIIRAMRTGELIRKEDNAFLVGGPRSGKKEAISAEMVKLSIDRQIEASTELIMIHMNFIEGYNRNHAFNVDDEVLQHIYESIVSDVKNATGSKYNKMSNQERLESVYEQTKKECVMITTDLMNDIYEAGRIFGSDNEDEFKLYWEKYVTLCLEISVMEKDFSGIKERVFATLLENAISIEIPISYIGIAMKRYDLENFAHNKGDLLLKQPTIIEFLTGKTRNDREPMFKSKDELFGYFDISVLKAAASENPDLCKYLRSVDVDELYTASKISQSTYMKYIDKAILIEKYNNGEISPAAFHNAVSAKEALEADTDEENILKALVDKKGRPLYHHDETATIWKQFEASKFSIDAVRAMERMKYISACQVANLYNESMSRKIAVELGEAPEVTADKLLEFFTPAAILSAIDKSPETGLAEFLKHTIHRLYEEKGQNLDFAIVDVINEKYGDDKSSAEKRIMKLYEEGYIDSEAVTYAGISEEKIIQNGYVGKKDTDKLIGMFNDGLVSQDFILESFDEDQIMDMISRGMSSKVLAGFYTTAQLIDFATPKENPETKEIIPAKLTMDNLRELKEDIVIGINGSEVVKSTGGSSSLLDLYTKELLDYDRLIELAKAGVITMDDAAAINDRYNLEKDWEDLKQQGITGNPISGILNSLGSGNGLPTVRGDAVGIDESCIWDLYIALGATEYLDIDKKKCPVFKDYLVIPLLDKKIAYLEGKDGRTYIVPLKIVMEQIHHPNGRLDLMGNASGRNDFNSNKDYIRSLNHTRNWGANIIKKTADLPIAPYSMADAEDMIKNNSQIRKAVEACGKSYDYRKMHR